MRKKYPYKTFVMGLQRINAGGTQCAIIYKKCSGHDNMVKVKIWAVEACQPWSNITI